MTRPDLCVEVLSPSTRDADRGRKMPMFARYGVREYWMADPEAQRIEICRLRRTSYVLAETVSGGGLVTSPLLPGLVFSARACFPA